MKKKSPRLSLSGKNGRKMTNGHGGSKEVKSKLSNKWVDEEIESGSDESDDNRHKGGDNDEDNDDDDEEIRETADQKRKRFNSYHLFSFKNNIII